MLLHALVARCEFGSRLALRRGLGFLRLGTRQVPVRVVLRMVVLWDLARWTVTPIFEGSLNEIKELSSHLDAQGIEYEVRVAKNNSPFS